MIKTETLKKNYEFRIVLTKGKYYSGKYIEIFIKKNNKNINRIGIAVSVKVANAVGRNRIKRVIRESFRQMETGLEDGYDIVILWKKKVDIKYASYNNISQDMEKILKNAEVIKI